MPRRGNSTDIFMRRMFSFLAITLVIVSCQSDQSKKPIVIEEVSISQKTILPGPEYLSEWGLFKGELANLEPVDGMIPYDLNTQLFTDYASKLRFVKLQSGTSAQFDATEVLDFPLETILVKNFFYPSETSKNGRRIIETRLLVHIPEGWNALTYVWNEEQTEAVLTLSGVTLPVSWTDESGLLKEVDYSVPNLVQCKSCHERKGRMTPIGPTVRQLNREYPYTADESANQIDTWKALGLLEGVPAGTLPKLPVWNDESTGTLSERARAWLEINCAHCHRSDGPAKNSGLHLLASETDKYRLGINKPPVAAGRGSAGLKYAVVPGNPEESILVHRIASSDPGVMMPELGRKLVHEEGVQLVADWIASMED